MDLSEIGKITIDCIKVGMTEKENNCLVSFCQQLLFFNISKIWFFFSQRVWVSVGQQAEPWYQVSLTLGATIGLTTIR